MKSLSLVSESFSVFGSLLRNKWMAYLWYVLMRIAEFVLLGLLGFVFLSQMMVLSDVSPVLSILFFGAGMVLLFLLESYFFFCLYRTLDQGNDSSLSTFMHKGAEGYWSRLGRYVLLSLLLIVPYFGISLFFAFFDYSEMIYSVASLVVLILGFYLSVPVLMVFFEIVTSDEKFSLVVAHVRERLRGLWWRSFGTILLWILLIMVSYGLFGVLVGGLLFAGSFSFFQSISALQGAPAAETFSTLFQNFSLGIFGPIAIAVVFFTILNIIPAYGIFSVYKGVKNIAPSK